jgi:hypothetical protein
MAKRQLMMQDTALHEETDINVWKSIWIVAGVGRAYSSIKDKNGARFRVTSDCANHANFIEYPVSGVTA